MYNVLSKPESALIDDIVHDVLKNMSPSFVGIKLEIEHIVHRLMRGDIVGIWGIGGISKTSLAQTVSRRINCQNGKEVLLSKLSEHEKAHVISPENRLRLGLTKLLIISNDKTKFLIGDPVSYDAIHRLKTDILKKGITGWVKGEPLGIGSFGSVYEGISDEGFSFAVKEVELLDQSSKGKKKIDQLEQEIALLSQFEHENIVQYIGTDKDESKLYIFLELATKGSLRNLYQRYRLRDSKVSAYTRQILHGLKYLHDRNVVHRDIKCANILVYGRGCVKLADFGLAKVTKLNDVKSFQGTAFWMAPEVFNNKNQGYGIQADIWSLGCTVLEMLTCQIPYSPLEWQQALCEIFKGVLPPIPDHLSKDARDFILKCLQTNPSDRPTAAQLLDHSFVKRPLLTFSCKPSPRLGKRKLKANGVVTSKLKRQ